MLGAEKDPMPVIKVIILDAIRAGFIKGKMMDVNIFKGDAPRFLAASMANRSICLIAIETFI